MLMIRVGGKKHPARNGICSVFLALLIFRSLAGADSAERAHVTVIITDAETSQPISQAHLTLQFREPGKKLKPKLPKHLSYSAKTNSQGRYRFTNIPKGTIHLIVTAERHQSFGRDFEIEQDNQVLEVKLKKPQPLL